MFKLFWVFQFGYENMGTATANNTRQIQKLASYYMNCQLNCAILMSLPQNNYTVMKNKTPFYLFLIRGYETKWLHYQRPIKLCSNTLNNSFSFLVGGMITDSADRYNLVFPLIFCSSSTLPLV